MHRMNRATKSEPIPDRRRISVWTFPEGSPPAVRVEVTTGKIVASTLMSVVFDTLGIHENSRRFFGLFKGLDPPQKMFGDDEVIFLPCKSVISLQKWSFDPAMEAKAIKSDVVSNRLFALQTNADVKSGRLVPTREQQAELEEYMDSDFPCYKQYVEFARSLNLYGSVVAKDVKLVSNLRLKEKTVTKGNRVDIACCQKKMIIITDKKELHIPWRKVRRWTQVSNFTSLSYEIYLMEEKAFTWIELETIQAPYLLQATSEFVQMMKTAVQKPEFKKPAWANKTRNQSKPTWRLFKKELFGVGEEDEPEPVLDNLENEASSSSDEDDLLAVYNTARQNGRKSKASASYAV